LVSPSQSLPFIEGFGFVQDFVKNVTPPPQLRMHGPGPIQSERPPSIPRG
jgi:hypothetical protein